jgi:hypothetical protein
MIGWGNMSQANIPVPGLPLPLVHRYPYPHPYPSFASCLPAKNIQYFEYVQSQPA